VNAMYVLYCKRCATSRELPCVVHTAKAGHEMTREGEVLTEYVSTLQHHFSSCSAMLRASSRLSLSARRGDVQKRLQGVSRRRGDR
jgi:hypothetical protein